jgi:hypothetical protein
MPDGCVDGRGDRGIKSSKTRQQIAPKIKKSGGD